MHCAWAELDLPASTKPGIYSLRLLSPRGVSNAVPFRVSDAPVVVEMPAPHASPLQFQEVQFPALIAGKLGSRVKSITTQFEPRRGNRFSLRSSRRRTSSRVWPCSAPAAVGSALSVRCACYPKRSDHRTSCPFSPRDLSRGPSGRLPVRTVLTVRKGIAGLHVPIAHRAQFRRCGCSRERRRSHGKSEASPENWTAPWIDALAGALPAASSSRNRQKRSIGRPTKNPNRLLKSPFLH